MRDAVPAVSHFPISDFLMCDGAVVMVAEADVVQLRKSAAVAVCDCTKMLLFACEREMTNLHRDTANQ
jgi:hypothetical protein